jgi:histone H3/H4
MDTILVTWLVVDLETMKSRGWQMTLQFRGESTKVGRLTLDKLTNENSENTGTLRGRISLASGRDSDIRPGILLADDTETTFVLTVPQRDPSEEPELEKPLELPDLDNDEGIIQEDEVEELEETDDEELQPQSSTKEPYGGSSLQDATPQDTAIVDAQQRKVVRKKKLKVSKHGIQYPSLPAGVVKKLATTFARTTGNRKAKINKEALEAIMQASDWFFEQVSDDLGAYAKHAGRKTIDESDIVTLMARYVEALPK